MEIYSISTLSALGKIGVFLGSWLILWLPIALVLGRKLNWKLGQSTTPAQKIPLVISLYLLAPVIIWGEKSSFNIYGLILGPSLPQGIAIGFTGIIIVYGLEGLLGWSQWHPDKLKGLIISALPLGLLALWLAGTEELIFRGIFFSELADDYGLICGAVISALIFALVHLLWERKETRFQLPGLWLMGMVLALAVVIDGGEISLAWGLHGGWIWGLAMLDSSGIISHRPNISPWLIGFHGSPIAGAVGILCLLATGLGLWIFQ